MIFQLYPAVQYSISMSKQVEHTAQYISNHRLLVFYGLYQLKRAFDNYFILSFYVCDRGEIHRAYEIKKTKSWKDNARDVQEM